MQLQNSLDRKQLGRKGEDIASAYLVKKGFKILHKNYRCFLGELDIVAQKGSTIIFTEVKTRSTKAFGYPEESVNRIKRKKIIRLAEYYLNTYKIRNVDCRFDVFSIFWNETGKCENMVHIPNAFTEDDI